MNSIIGKNIANRNAKLDMLEELIDIDGLDGLCDLLANVASAKADGVHDSYPEPYGDEAMCDPEADRWDKIVVEFLTLERKLKTI